MEYIELFGYLVAGVGFLYALLQRFKITEMELIFKEIDLATSDGEVTPEEAMNIIKLVMKSYEE